MVEIARGVRVEANNLCPHGILAKPFMTSHLCWQDRVQKEWDADWKKKGGTPVAHLQKLSHSPVREYFPIGGQNALNNASEGMKRTIAGHRARRLATESADWDLQTAAPSGLAASSSLPSLTSNCKQDATRDSSYAEDRARLAKAMREHAQRLMRKRHQRNPHPQTQAHRDGPPRWQDGYYRERPEP
mmetsp:Transcript_148798/g.459640  ORF Transcript_148798/g.459640 Transcript_148798/m.459640 type:complete len:187 (+) Transcript_148798:140-700(+)|eukprot:CAMPEP_0204593174 /NCGR_PEP_ID=MMETSP0661-20131031/51357_1 /ASSEMBLY_ACC=CAM_ASM_000606 /TAXON_ID=109239 /ORGANISM="Alexandrium margalefi, Strain AMGDE01CS-322" /LENGTH=186 /DNA_ID=CAMNT_0051603463 /DNA_START=140 /DNA_END=700 /DNA_ORIENTATION=+